MDPRGRDTALGPWRAERERENDGDDRAGVVGRGGVGGGGGGGGGGGVVFVFAVVQYQRAALTRESFRMCGHDSLWHAGN